jgi:hypothetical protein
MQYIQLLTGCLAYSSKGLCQPGLCALSQSLNARCRAGYDRKVTGKTAEERLDMRAATKTDKFCVSGLGGFAQCHCETDVEQAPKRLRCFASADTLAGHGAIKSLAALVRVLLLLLQQFCCVTNDAGSVWPVKYCTLESGA